MGKVFYLPSRPSRSGAPPVREEKRENPDVLQVRRGAYCKALNLFLDRVTQVLTKLRGGTAPSTRQCKEAAEDLVEQTALFLKVLHEKGETALQASVTVTCSIAKDVVEYLTLHDTSPKKPSDTVLDMAVLELNNELLLNAARPFFS